MENISGTAIFNIAKGLEKYQRIMHELHRTDVSVDAEFQRVFTECGRETRHFINATTDIWKCRKITPN